MEKLGRGYIGKSMSVNALIAYEEEEMPISKWTKKTMIEKISEMLDDDNLIIDGLKKQTKEEMQKNFLIGSSYHHTGTFYQTTNFYKIDVDVVMESAREMTKEEMEEKEKVNKQKGIEKELLENFISEKEKNEEEEKLFLSENGFAKTSVANYIRNNNYTERKSKKGNVVVEFEFNGVKYVVEKNRINVNLIGYKGE